MMKMKPIFVTLSLVLCHILAVPSLAADPPTKEELAAWPRPERSVRITDLPKTGKDSQPTLNWKHTKDVVIVNGLSILIVPTLREQLLWDKLRNRSGRSEKQIGVLVTIENFTDQRKINFRRWSRAFETGKRATLVDDIGNSYKIITDTINLRHALADDDDTPSIYPGKESADVVCFERPVGQSKTLTMTLPLENLGIDNTLIVNFPVDDIRELERKIEEAKKDPDTKPDAPAKTAEPEPIASFTTKTGNWKFDILSATFSKDTGLTLDIRQTNLSGGLGGVHSLASEPPKYLTNRPSVKSSRQLKASVVINGISRPITSTPTKEQNIKSGQSFTEQLTFRGSTLDPRHQAYLVIPAWHGGLDEEVKLVFFLDKVKMQ